MWLIRLDLPHNLRTPHLWISPQLSAHAPRRILRAPHRRGAAADRAALRAVFRDGASLLPFFQRGRESRSGSRAHLPAAPEAVGEDRRHGGALVLPHPADEIRAARIVGLPAVSAVFPGRKQPRQCLHRPQRGDRQKKSDVFVVSC